MTVRLLEEHVVNQIAAGEVIERPASVVKELVENSLDADARTLEVLLVDGGRQRIRIRDDGHGMGEQDAMMCLERHATSKIRHAEDLARIATLGFRGEALPSIAAVSRFELTTRAEGQDEATRLRVEGGTLTDVRKVGGPLGTEIDVRSLFFNVPVRRKFLRTKGTELSHCLEAITRVALMRPDVDLTVRHGERELMRAPRSDLQRRAIDVLGRDAQRLVPVALARDGIEVTGLASPPGAGRSSANGALYLYVNGRWVKDLVLRRAIYQAYRDLTPRGRYPLVILDVRVEPSRVDVNVHPTKAEVRFVSPRDVTAMLAEGLRVQVLAAGDLPEPRHRPQRGGFEVDRASLPLSSPAPWAASADRPLNIPAHPDDDPRVAQAPPPTLAPQAAPPTSSGAESVAEPPPAASRPHLVAEGAPRWRARHVVGVARRRWVMLEDDAGVVVFDGARASLKLALMRATSTRLMVPIRVSMGADGVSALARSADTLSALGLEVVPFSPQEVAVKAVPSALVELPPEEVVRAALWALERGKDVVETWLRRLEPPPIEEDLFEVRTLLATLDEAGLDPESRTWVWEQLP